MYTRSQNYTNKMVGKHGIQTFKVVVVVLLLWLLSFDVFVPRSTHPLLLFDNWFVQMYLIINCDCDLNSDKLTILYSLHVLNPNRIMLVKIK